MRLRRNRPAARFGGTAAAGRAPLPGVGITISPKAGGPTITTSTGQNGTYTASVPGPGTYALAADLAGFAPVTLDVVVEPSCQAQQNIALTLASRVEAPKPAAPVDQGRPQRQLAHALPTNARPLRRSAAPWVRRPRRRAHQVKGPARDSSPGSKPA